MLPVAVGHSPFGGKGQRKMDDFRRTHHAGELHLLDRLEYNLAPQKPFREMVRHAKLDDARQQGEAREMPLKIDGIGVEDQIGLPAVCTAMRLQHKGFGP